MGQPGPAPVSVAVPQEWRGPRKGPLTAEQSQAATWAEANYRPERRHEDRGLAGSPTDESQPQSL